MDPPSKIVGTSVGALNGSAIAAYPSLAGTMMLREVWVSRQAIDVFRAHPVGMILSGLKRDQVSAFPQQNILRLIERAQALTGITTFEQLRVPLAVVATDLNAGKPAVFRAGELTPALLASTAIPGLFPTVRIGDREHFDGGIARTLQLSLHHQMLADYEKLRERSRIVVLCPVTSATATWDMKRDRLDAVMESSRAATASLLSKRGSKLFRHSGIHYMELQ